MDRFFKEASANFVSLYAKKYIYIITTNKEQSINQSSKKINNA